ncbi:MAG: rhomboid family intramembrane serine protease [Halobacteriales archaeon]|nr:rhomboid family intramembrane serine protease [Halobacteriales archaeon]
MAIHERVWERAAPQAPPPRPARPVGTYALLGTIVGVWVLELLLLPQPVSYAGGTTSATAYGFVINTDWPSRPWTLVTSTLAHDPRNISHLLFNGLFLFFFGPLVERIVGTRRYLVLFLVAGAVSGIAQVHLSAALGHGGGALGASGALMALFGVVMVLLPKERIFIYGIVPVPMWIAGILYAALDVLGVLNPYSPVGNIAHLSGMALGLGYGAYVKQDLKRRGLRLTRG